MQFKIDENLPVEAADEVRHAGYDVATVVEQRLSGRPDDEVFAVCKAELRILVTLDTDFANTLVYPPAASAGLVVLRVEDQSKPSVLRLVRQVVTTLRSESPERRLWIVEPGRIRVRGDA